jgi:class 3 adenylate cyclase/pimeloyl-ACP methyl ester carboxylesterase
MEPRIQYAKTSDGVNIAYATAGDGPPLLMVAVPPITHVQAAWEAFAYAYQPLAQHFHLVWYDFRGTGLSDREAIDFSMDAMIRDVEAVVESARLTGFAIVASDAAVPIAVTYAATRPEKVSFLILVDGLTKYSDYYQNPGIVAEEALRSGDWTLFSETLARLWLGFENQELAAQFAVYIRECVEPEAYRSAMSSMGNEDWDVAALLPRVTANTLVVHNRNNRFLPVQAGQRLAAGISNARFQVVDDMAYVQMPNTIIGFLSEGAYIPVTTHPEHVAGPSGTAIILFADIADSTALTERLGDAAFRARARELDGALRTVIREHSGTPIEGKLLGDGVLALFTSARQAIEAALACGAAGSDAGLPLHLGLHAGDVIREDNNVYGGAVNIASRISGLSSPGEVLVSDIVRGLARTSAGVRFEDRGEQALKGVGEAVRAWAVRPLDTSAEADYSGRAGE